MKTWVEMNHVIKQMDDFQLGPVDLTLEAGTITALVGNNGSGKSTLLKLLMHLAKPDEGGIHLFREAIDSTDKNWKPHVAYLPQQAVGVQMFTGEALRELTASWYPDWDEDYFRYLVKQFGIPLRKKYSKLSPGMQQKLHLALTLPRNASLMILDEPTSFLDIPSTKMLGDILANWMDNGERAIFMTSHQIEDVRKLADYIAILHDGKMRGPFEKDALQENFRRYWLQTDLPQDPVVPGEVSRSTRQIVTNDASRTEDFFNNHGIVWYDQKPIELEEILAIIMQQNE